MSNRTKILRTLVVLGILACIAGAGVAGRLLVDDTWIKGWTAEELGAAAIGFQLPFYAVLICVTLLMALQVTDPVI